MPLGSVLGNRIIFAINIIPLIKIKQPLFQVQAQGQVVHQNPINKAASIYTGIYTRFKLCVCEAKMVTVNMYWQINIFNL